jgi:2,3-dihydroxybenzoate decarboxylase
MVRKIALEEHVMCPGLEDYWKPTVADIGADVLRDIVARLSDFGGRRLEAMDQTGIERAVLSLAGPGVQTEPDTATACRKAQECNDFLAREIQKRPDRYSAFGHVALQDPKAAADELERCMRALKFCGVMINGHSNGTYLDHPSLYPFWERAEALGAIVYLHPADPIAPAPVLEGYQGLRRATWEWTFETGSHALRLVFGGTFNRFPRAKLMLGHLGETLPYLLWRFDSRAIKLYGLKFPKTPSQYIKDNIVVTTSGMCSAEPLTCAVSALGLDRVMFATDYPFESAQESAEFIEQTPLAGDARADICFNNAAKLLGLAKV